MPILERQLSLKKDMEARFKRMDELCFFCFLDHILMQNMHNMKDMAFAKKEFTSFKKFYVDNCS